MVIIIVILIIIYIAVGVFTGIAATTVKDDPTYDDNEDLNTAHMYFSWATSITWIIFGLSILGIILLVILAIVAGASVGAAAATTYGAQIAGSLTSKRAKTEQEIENGFLGVQAINKKGGVFGTFFKIFLGLMIVILTLVGLLSALGLIYILRSDSSPGLSYAMVAVFLSLLPLVLLIVLELANFVYLKRKKDKLEAQEAELRQIKLDIIAKKAESGGYNKPQPVAKTSSVAQPPATTPPPTVNSSSTATQPPTAAKTPSTTPPTAAKTPSSSSLYSFNSTPSTTSQPPITTPSSSSLYSFDSTPSATPTTTAVKTSPSTTSSLYNFLASEASKATSSLYSFA